ncbi:MAG: epoxyqueuosine reductase QueH [Erysipelotrichaceae bacterium]|nr:epoxyqueuosine reductase QueH [Erysipelotrichaceae bacterium]
MSENYDLKFQKELKKIEGQQPTLLLHVCCGPCCSNVVKELCEKFKITIYYSNSNIYPEEEYYRRLNELKSFIVRFNEDYHQNIEVIEDIYTPKDWITDTYPLKDMPEGGMRCRLCYMLRMRRAFDNAKKNKFDYWTTVLSVSPHKNSQWINLAGEQWNTDTTKYLYADFKKRDGYLKSTQMSKEYNMYRQNYCGCMYSYRDMLKREANK